MGAVLDSGFYIMGQQHGGFEAEFAELLGVQHVIGVANGTDALELALLSVGCERGDRVITAANAGGYATAACLKLGAQPYYVDVDEASLLLTESGLAAAFNALPAPPRAVIVTHLYGAMADVAAIATLCRRYEVALIEDCAQAAGARLDGRCAGSFGDVGTFSFYPTKNLGALGDGGAVCTNEPGRAEQLKKLRQYGWGSKYDAVIPAGRNSRLDELQAAVLRTRIPRLDADNERRRGIHDQYSRAVKDGPLRMVHQSDSSFVSHLAVVLATDRTAARSALHQAGVRTDVHYPTPDHRQKISSDRLSALRLPVTEWAAEHVFTVPCFPELCDEEIARVCDALSAL
ncbi:MAG: dTDP-4-amino-4,6-dideoxygalactose transaminase [Frankiales bacterium]|nr:dTDP-4-amino-4,6-dideoxygalactose transaminase [Frankiales bacterium]